MKYILTICIYALAAIPLAAQTDVVLTAPDVRGYPVNTVPFRIIENGNIVDPIDTARLRFYEEGIALDYSVVCPEQVAQSASVAIGLERSLDNNFGIAKQAARDFVEVMQWTDVPNNASFWSFATPIDREVDVVRDSARIWNAVNGTDVANFPFNGTPLWETMHRAIEDIVEFGTERVRAIVFFTDGRNNTSYFNTSRQDVINRANVDGVRVYVVAVKSNAGDQAALADLCAQTGGIMRTSDEPTALRDIYAHLTQPSVFDYWCTLEYRSPLCPNGSSRNITVRYDFPTAGTIDETVGYTAPYRERELTQLHMYTSPRIVAVRPGDTLWAAFGVNLVADALVGDMRLQLSHPGLTAIGTPEVLEGLAGWSVDIVPSPSFTSVELTAPGDVVADSGLTRWFRLQFVAEARDTVQFESTLLYDATQCLVLQPYAVTSAFRIQLDTVVTAWGDQVEMPFRMKGAVPPEGIQEVAAEVIFNPRRIIPIPTGTSMLRGLPPGWTIRRDVIAPQDSTTALQFTIGGPPIDDAIELARIRWEVQDDAFYLNTAALSSALVNAFALEGLTAADPGLVVIRDSCHNQYSVVQQGLAVSGPAPNPVRGSALFELRAPEPLDVTITVYNALGVACGEPVFRALPQGKAALALPLGSLDDGVYLVRFASSRGTVTQRMVVGK